MINKVSIAVAKSVLIPLIPTFAGMAVKAAKKAYNTAYIYGMVCGFMLARRNQIYLR